MTGLKLYVVVTGILPPGFGGTAARTIYAAQSWKRLEDGTLVIINGDVEAGTWAPGQWARAELTRAATIEEAAEQDR